jgi:putative endonuclease
MFYVYILYSATLHGYYVGYTSTSVDERLYKHLHSKKGHTAKTKDWAIVLVESFDSKQLAMAREKQLKAWKSKVKIQELIKRCSTE